MSALRVTAAITGAADDAALAATLERLRAQEGVQLEVLVIDRPAVAGSPELATPPGIAMRRLHCGGGPHEALDLAVAEATTEIITFLRPGDRPLRGAIARLAAAIAEDPAVRLAHTRAFRVDAAGRIPKLALRELTARIRRAHPGTLDHRRALLAGTDRIGALPTYRRTPLLSMGGFDAGDRATPHDSAAVRLLERGEVVLVPDMLCGSPDGAAPASDRRSGLAGFRALARDTLRRIRRFERRGFAGLLMAVGAGPLYPRLANGLRWWPVGRATAAARAGPQRIAYVLWHFPILSETFIRREIRALRGLGFDIDVVADAPEAAEPDFAATTDSVLHLEPIDAQRLRRFVWRLLLRRPRRLLGRFAFIVSRRYGSRKTLADDVRTLRAAIYLAGVLEERGITHVHAPWADRHAFISLIAARLIGASFSLNLRAHEIHSRHSAFALTEKIAAARFAVTNSRYNLSRLTALACPVAHRRVHVIYNGLDLEHFDPPVEAATEEDAVPRLLSVGRLVQQKGFDRLLEACALLRDRSVDFRCDIIGAAAEPAETATAVRLRIQQRRLGLEDHVRFLGPLPLSHVLAELRETDVFVLPCVVTAHGGRDVTPNALLEAMAMRRAVITTPVGAIPELVDDGANGLLVPPGDAVALAGAIQRLLGDRPLRQRLGQAARRKVEERFDIRRNVERYAQLFRDAVR